MGIGVEKGIEFTLELLVGEVASDVAFATLPDYLGLRLDYEGRTLPCPRRTIQNISLLANIGPHSSQGRSFCP